MSRHERHREPPVVFGRTPPHDLDAEAIVLSACLLDRDKLDEVAVILEPESFYSEANATIFRGALELARAGKPVDAVSVNTWLRDRELHRKCGGAEYLAQLTDATPAVYNVEHHARTVKEKWRLRRTIATCQEFAARGYGDVGEPQDFIEDLEAKVIDLSGQHASTAEPETLRTTMTRVFTEMQQGGKRGYPTELLDLDRVTDGLFPGELTIIGARPGIGKTALCDRFEVAVARTSRWVHAASLEMPAGQRAQRKLASEARVDMKGLRTGRLANREAWSAATAAASRLAELGIVTDDTPGQHVEHIRAAARRTAARARKCGAQLGLVTVDYLQLARTRKRCDKREQEIAEVSRQLKELAKELGVPVVATAQLNRAVEGRSDKRPSLGDLRESGQIEQDGDVIVFIYRDDYYDEASDDRGIAELIIAKHRNGETGTVKVKFDAFCTRFDNLAPVADRWEAAE